MTMHHVAGALLAGCLVAGQAQAQTVDITPLGSHDGEFCLFDRAMLLVDPDGTRILYDPGRTVAGAEDPRLGDVDALLVSHMHGDHVGDRRIGAVNAGACGKPDVSVETVPNTNTVDIALAKSATIVSGSEMPQFFGGKLKALGGDAAKSQLVRFGGSRKIGGVAITTVPAVHSNGISGAMIPGDLGPMLDAAGLTAYAGPPTGFVLTFSNGLVVYLSGDTGVTAEQKTVVADQYGADVVVMNIGDTFTTGPTEAAHVINTLIKPKAVIPSHANEEATKGGAVVPGTKTATFIDHVKVPVLLPLSGRTLSFNGDGTCTAEC
ncbi:MAG: metal-dependent hydrolase [Rhodospirillaceae bacterium BRH_c57]|nr:MAG: metal-dependent hydrolase [Rhodospirillaceae bacterium BRH_c57]